MVGEVGEMSMLAWLGGVFASCFAAKSEQQSLGDAIRRAHAPQTDFRCPKCQRYYALWSKIYDFTPQLSCVCGYFFVKRDPKTV